MSPRLPKMSIPMPPTHGLFYTDGQTPHTPQHDEISVSLSEPPPPPRQTYKVRRKRATILPAGTNIMETENAIPTIEMSEAMDSSPELASPMLAPVHTAAGLLAPMTQLIRSVTPPKTPATRLLSSFDSFESPAQEWGLITDQKPPFERTGSIGSSFSDSSISSLGSSAFSAVSPLSEANDPFAENESTIRDKAPMPAADCSSPGAKRAKISRRATIWTSAMDDHLWITYMAYLSDPTLTPFKMLPGTAPPLGVCHRVASRARRTWRGRRTVSSTAALDNLFSVPSHEQRQGTPDTIRAESPESATAMAWPRSESDTRKRLRALCKRRPSLSAHYQRLLRTRSPSPFQSSSSASRSTEPPTTFESSEMKISLITSTNASMQPDGPLAQLTSEDLPPRPQSQKSSRPTDWFARIGRSQAHQKSLSLQSGLGLDTSARSGASLASPFDEVSSRSHLLQSMSTTKSLGRDFHRAAPFLDAPFEVQGPLTAPRSLKRRFRSDEEKPRRLPLHGIFSSDGTDDSASTSRTRGFSLGGSAPQHLNDIFHQPELEPSVSLHAPTPVSAFRDHDMIDTPDLSMLGPPGSRSAPRRLADPQPRLGSPFVEAASASRNFNTFPRSILPTSDDPQPFQRRLQELASQHAEQMQQ